MGDEIRRNVIHVQCYAVTERGNMIERLFKNLRLYRQIQKTIKKKNEKNKTNQNVVESPMVCIAQLDNQFH